MKASRLAILVVSVAVCVLRLTIPGVSGHGVAGVTWEDSYEAFAHIWVGILIVLAFVPACRWPAVTAAVLLTIVEGVAFAIR